MYYKTIEFLKTLNSILKISKNNIFIAGFKYVYYFRKNQRIRLVLSKNEL